MPAHEVRQRVEGRLEELYKRHLSPHDDQIVSYYKSGIGYYKPEISEAEQKRFAVCLATTDGEVYHAGDYDWSFALQSISKVFVYGLALEAHGRDHVLERVGVEPSGDAFHSIVFDERNNRPYNPMVNAGALVTTDLVENLALYLRQCSVCVTSRDLAVMGATLANGGVNPITGEKALTPRYVRDVLSVMYTCGMYDFAGQWAYQIGIPAKSRVSGGILAIVPGKGGIGVFSPGLDEHGNSVRGINVCEEISARLGLHIFAHDAEDALLRPVENLR